MAWFPSPPSGFINWGRGQGEGADVSYREKVLHRKWLPPHSNPLPRARALGGEGERLALAGMVTLMTRPEGERYQQQIERWHAQRIARLAAPDGWLSLVGLEWLKPGANRVGSASDNDIVLAKASARLGTITWADDGSLSIALDATEGVTIDGVAKTHAVLRDDSQANPTTVAFGTVHFIAVERGGRKGLRVRDSEAETRTHFQGIERFPVDRNWCIEADWVPLDPPFQLATGTVIGTIENYPAPGRAVFERDGQRFELYPVLEAPGDMQLFLIFADATSGLETYGAARFLYADMPRDGRIVLDFNKAYNPPCAFTPYATCPLAPPENRLALRVTAGELKYAKKPWYSGTFQDPTDSKSGLSRDCGRAMAARNG